MRIQSQPSRSASSARARRRSRPSTPASSTSAPARAIDEGTRRTPSTGVGRWSSASGTPVDERVVDGAVERGTIDPESARRVALGIEIDDEDVVTEESQIGCEIDHRGGLPDAALLIGAGDRLAHSASCSKHTHHRRILASEAPSAVPWPDVGSDGDGPLTGHSTASGSFCRAVFHVKRSRWRRTARASRAGSAFHAKRSACARTRRPRPCGLTWPIGCRRGAESSGPAIARSRTPWDTGARVCCHSVVAAAITSGPDRRLVSRGSNA